MYHKFNAKEILEMAELIEKNGHEFYKKAAEDVKDADIKTFLLDLAEMELKHEVTFQEMKAGLTSKEKADVVFDPDDEAALYLQALADTRVFFEKNIDTSSAQEVLKEAITAEKESIVFYLGMRDMVPDDAGKAKINGIITEEMSHIQVISAKLLTLNG
jgi:rubrerythrin